MTIIDEVKQGLSSNPKWLPSKLFYDERGSRLFDQICELDEYYPTRTEEGIIADNLKEIINLFNKDTVLLEFGSGSSKKTRMLLSSFKQLKAYVPIDISESYLNAVANELRKEFVKFPIVPVAADYTKPLNFPSEISDAKKKIAFFPGSTIGNFLPDEARKFLKVVAEECGTNGGLLIGVDLIKDENVLNMAYNDSKGITAAFNLNLLTHLNNQFCYNFNIDNYQHKAFYNSKFNRIEMHLVSKANQLISMNGNSYTIKKDESILTEYSHKYSLKSFEELCNGIFNVEKVWTDDKYYFSLHYLSAV